MSKTVKVKKSGGSATIKARGLGRGGEVSPGDPSKFCAIDGKNDGDMSLNDLLDRYKGNQWAQTVIRACADEKRAGEGAEPFFWHRLRSGVNHPIRYVDLGEDRFGKIWLPIADGRHRKAGVILVNVERASSADPEPIELPGWAIKLPKGDANAEKAAEIVRRIKNDANIYNRMKPSHLAARAAEWAILGNSFHVIAQKLALGVDADRAEEIVPWYLALGQAVPEIQDAADAGKFEIDAIRKIAKPTGDLKLSPSEQRAWLADLLAPKVRKPRDTSSPRPLAPKKVGKLAEALAKHYANDKRMSELCLIFAGKVRPEDAKDFANRKFLTEAIGVTFEEA